MFEGGVPCFQKKQPNGNERNPIPMIQCLKHPWGAIFKQADFALIDLFHGVL